MANIGGKVETETNFLSLGSKITADSDCSHEIKLPSPACCGDHCARAVEESLVPDAPGRFCKGEREREKRNVNVPVFPLTSGRKVDQLAPAWAQREAV